MGRNPFSDIPDLPEDDDLGQVDFWDGLERAPLTQEQQSFLEGLGIESFEGVIVDVSNIDPDKIPPRRFPDFEQALRYLYDGGIIDLFDVAFIRDEQLFAVVKRYPYE